MRSLTPQQLQIFEARAALLLRTRADEDEHQCLAADYLDALGLLWFHPPLGGHRNKAVAGQLKAQGAKAGVPDILIFDPPKGRGNNRGTAIELKRPGAAGQTYGKAQRLGCSSVSAAQQKWLYALAVRRWIVRVCFGFDEVQALCKELGYER